MTGDDVMRWTKGERVWLGFWLAVATAAMGVLYVPLVAWLVTRGW